MHGAFDQTGFDSPARDLAPDPLQERLRARPRLPVGLWREQFGAAPLRDKLVSLLK